MAEKWGITKATKEVFEPTDIAGVQLWLDSSDTSTLFTDSACSTAVSANNDPVGCWKDKKGSGTPYNFIQSTAGSRPSYLTNNTNGLSVISTDNANSTYLLTADLRDTTGGKVDMKFTNPTIFVTTAIKTINTNYMGIFSCSSNIQSDDASPDGFVFQANTGNQVAINRYNGSADNIGFGITSIGSSTTVMNMMLNSGTASLWNKGTSLGTDAYSDTTEINPYKCLIGARMNNSGGVASPYGRNYYNEILIYDQVLTSAQREQMEAYLHTKWGIR